MGSDNSATTDLTDDNGNDPLEPLREMEQATAAELRCLNHLLGTASVMGDRLPDVDSMTVRYERQTNLGCITLYYEYYDWGEEFDQSALHK
jgi:hypothetical protein